MEEKITFDTAVHVYLTSQKFRGLAFNSKRNYLDGINTLKEHLGGKRLDEITRPMVVQLRDCYYEQRGKCMKAMSALNNILKLAYDHGHVDRNVAAGIGDMPKGVPIERWSNNEIACFIGKGCPSYMLDALLLALFTGQRRCDLVRMRWTDYDGATLHVIQQKTGVELWIPVHPKLRQHLDAMLASPRRFRHHCDRILQNAHGDPWSVDALSAAFRRRCDEIGIDRVLHGLRKTTAAMLAEMGCNPLQIMAITGHKTFKEIIRYTEEAEKRKLAQEAMDKWH